jgi:hypothetical protein
VSRVELLDEVQVKAINIANGKSFPECPTLMFEFIGTGEHGLNTAFLSIINKAMSFLMNPPDVLEKL